MPLSARAAFEGSTTARPGVRWYIQPRYSTELFIWCLRGIDTSILYRSTTRLNAARRRTSLSAPTAHNCGSSLCMAGDARWRWLRPGAHFIAARCSSHLRPGWEGSMDITSASSTRSSSFANSSQVNQIRLSASRCAKFELAAPPNVNRCSAA